MDDAPAPENSDVLHSVLDSSTDLWLVTDRAWVIHYANSTWLSYYRQTREEVEGRPLADLFPAAGYLEELLPMLERVLAGEIIEREQQLVFPARGRRQSLLRFLPWRGPDDAVLGLILQVQDGSRSHGQENDLHQLWRAVEQLPVSLLLTNADGRIDYVNHYFCQHTGYERRELLGHNPRLLQAPDSPTDFTDMWQALRGGRTWTGEFLNRIKSGEDRWERAVITPVVDGSGVVTHFLAVMEDVTENRNLREELEQNRVQLLRQHAELQQLFGQVERAKQEWEQILDQLETLVIYVDAAGLIQRCNRATTELLDIPMPQLIGQPVGHLTAAFGGTLELQAGTNQHCLHAPSGRWFTFTIQSRMAGDSNAGLVITAQDITAIKQANTELEAQGRELAAAYARLQQSQSTLLQQEKMASIGQLAAGVAHEINNPIGFITSNLGSLHKYLDKLTDFIGLQQELLEPVLDDAGRERLGAARRKLQLDFLLEDCADLLDESLEGTERVRVIVQGLKSFSRVDQAEVKPVDLNDCLESTIRIVWNEIKYKAQLERDFGELPLVSCNAQQLNQVFMNLLVNAAQSIERDGLIRVTTRPDEGGVLVSVSDNGCGIPPQHLSRIFEPFFTTKPVGKGTGLGMSIAYDIVKKHGGDLQVESEVGRGTTFSIHLPLTPSEAD